VATTCNAGHPEPSPVSWVCKGRSWRLQEKSFGLGHACRTAPSPHSAGVNGCDRAGEPGTALQGPAFDPSSEKCTVMRHPRIPWCRSHLQREGQIGGNKSPRSLPNFRVSRPSRPPKKGLPLECGTPPRLDPGSRRTALPSQEKRWPSRSKGGNRASLDGSGWRRRRTKLRLRPPVPAERRNTKLVHGVRWCGECALVRSHRRASRMTAAVQGFRGRRR